MIVKLCVCVHFSFPKKNVVIMHCPCCCAKIIFETVRFESFKNYVWGMFQNQMFDTQSFITFLSINETNVEGR